MSQITPHSSELKKEVGSFGVLSLGVGAMVGFGWVILVGDWIMKAGSFGAILAFLIGGLMMGVVALVYAELVAAMPHAGGEHNYIMRALGPRWSLFGSWAITGGYSAVIAFESVALPRALGYIVPLDKGYMYTVDNFEVYALWVAAGSVTAILITIINVLGVKFATNVQIFVVVFLFAVGALQLCGVFIGGDMTKLEPFFGDRETGGLAGFVSVLVVVPFMFVGFDVIPQTAEEANLPSRKIGMLSFNSVVVAAIWYMLIIFGVSVALDASELANSELPAADGFAALFGGSKFIANLIVAAGLAGILTSWNSLQMGAARLLYSLARGGMLPRWLAYVHPKFGTPMNAVILLGLFATVAPFFGRSTLVWVVDASSPMVVIAYMMVAISFVVLRYREPDMERPLWIGGRGLGGKLIGYLAIAITIFLITCYIPGIPWAADLSWQSWVIFGLWWLFGLYFTMRVPGGIKPGPLSETQVLQVIEERHMRKKAR
ncbi:APC family permease [Canibacter zhoujuaniae]|uniref:APC family permease n=1 Tax=Canibacter zhoujuaniae TaxID=2708343 RepID=UPI00141FB967|nr:APC family permease [Canibacter zhoujuaniae]